MSSMARKRIMRELKQIEKDLPKGELVVMR